jgi:hypothetical protein
MKHVTRATRPSAEASYKPEKLRVVKSHLPSNLMIVAGTFYANFKPKLERW